MGEPSTENFGLLGAPRNSPEFLEMLREIGASKNSKPSVYSLNEFFGRLLSREATMLFAISGDERSLRHFANTKDPFYTKNFRDACKGVLRKEYNVRKPRVAQLQTARL